MIGSTWSSLASIGGGLIFCAIAAGFESWLAFPLIALAVIEMLWGAFTMRAGRILRPKTVVVACIIIAATTGGLLFLDVIGAIPFLALIALHWVTAIFAVLQSRRRPQHNQGPRVTPGAFVLALSVQALLIAAITTPALANTGPGESAVPHGTFDHH